MKFTTFLLSLIFTFFLTIPIFAEEGKYIADGFKEVEVKGIIFQWKISEKNIDIVLSAPTEGWVAVGFNPSKMMKDADFLIGYIKNGEVFLRDDFGSGNTQHRADTDFGGTDNITIKGGSETDTATTLRFSIPLDSGDPKDRKLIQGREYKLIFAYGRDDSFISYHKVRAGLMITL